jgi:hypothetical protein
MKKDFDSSVFARDTILDLCHEFERIIQYEDISSKVSSLIKLRKRIIKYIQIENDKFKSSDIKPLPIAEFLLDLVNKAIKSFY